jgi:GT2 family glycosyltransferase
MPAVAGTRRVLGRVKRRILSFRPGARRTQAEVQTVLATGLFATEFYLAQVGTNMSASAACLHYLRTGAAEGYLPSPFVDQSIAWSKARSRALAEAMRSGRVNSALFSTSIDWAAYVESVPAAAKHCGGPVGHFAMSAGRVTNRLVDFAGKPFPWYDLASKLPRRRRLTRIASASVHFDRRYYELQVGHRFLSRRAAVWHFVSSGEAGGLAPHPLIEPAWVKRRRRGTGSMGVFAEWVTNGQLDVAPHPHFDPEAYLAEFPEAAEHEAGPLGHFLEHADLTTTTYPVEGVPRRNWLTLLAELEDGARQYAHQQELTTWGAPRALATDGAERAGSAKEKQPKNAAAPPSVTVLVDTTDAGEHLARNLASVRQQSHPHVEILAVGASSRAPKGVRVVVSKADTHSARVNAAAAEATGEFLFVWDARDAVPKWFLRESVAAAVREGADLVYSPLAGATPADVTVLGEPYSRDGLLWGDPTALVHTAVVRTSAFRALGGWEEALPAFADWDFALRVSEHRPVAFLERAGVRRRFPEAPEEDAADLSAYRHVVRARALCDWAEAASRPRVADRVSLLVPVFRDWEMTVTATTAALDTTIGSDVEVVLVDNGSGASVSALIAAQLGHQPRVTRIRLPRNTNFSTGSNLALLASTGSMVAFVNNDTTPEPGWLEPLVAALADENVRASQPLLLYPDGSVQTAGTVFLGQPVLPWHFLAGHPCEDAYAASQTRFNSVTGAFMMCRADEVMAVRGFDPIYVNGMEDVDLCLRLVDRFGGDFRVAVDSLVIHAESKSPGRHNATDGNRATFMERWADDLPGSDLDLYRAAGLEASYRSTELGSSDFFRVGTVMVSRPARVVAEGPAAGLPALRWAIKTAARSDHRGDSWGDTFFAGDLARALRRLGQEVVIDRRETVLRPSSSHLDDVIVTLRGLQQVSAQPGATSILWVISHPELVSPRELRTGYDLVYGASVPWSEEASALSGRLVRPLLQATDPERFHPETDGGYDYDALFVGRTRKVFRPIVRDALAVGADLALFGDGWGEFIDEKLVTAEFLPNDELPHAYRHARVVLNDHWEDMAELGFLSNRLFDAAATGARIVTDRVAGIEGVFGDLVQQYESPEDLARLLDPHFAGWPSDAQRRADADRVAREHSFDARARTLLADVLDERGVAHDLPSTSSGSGSGSATAR